jgi:hypothetical protein
MTSREARATATRNGKIEWNGRLTGSFGRA